MFFAQFHVCAVGNKWATREKGWQLATALRGVASEVLAHVDMSHRDAYKRLKKAILLRYQVTPLELLSRIWPQRGNRWMKHLSN